MTSQQSTLALVTGAASGIGKATALRLFEQKARVVALDRSQESLDALMSETQSNGIIPCCFDLQKIGAIPKLISDLTESHGPITQLVNNAGVADPKRFLKVDEASWDFVVDTNLKGAWRVASEGSNRMVAAGVAGNIINVASILGLRVGLDQSTYSISKAGVVQMTRVMALELIRKGIRVNALCPGYFATEMNQDYFETERGKAYIKKIPAQRLGNIDELAGPLLLLASDAGSYINGVALPVDGGHLVQSL